MTTTTTLPNVSAVQGGNPLKGLLAYGQSPWLDYIRRNILLNGDLKKMIANDGLRGMTSNPTIFEKAITGSDDYADLLNAPEAKTSNAKGLYERIAIRDVQAATDIFRSVYDETKGRDGFVSLEVSPTLANDTQSTLEEARRLWKTVNRENLMVKVPATKAGIPAIRQLLEEGININITLLFAQSAYEQVAEAYIAALEARAAKGQDVSKIASVASFFVSRIDTLIDGQIDAKLKTETDAKKRELLSSVQGKVAIANARRTYAKYQELVGGPRWKALASKGAQTQRLLWASTSTKNAKYRDVLYVEELKGANKTMTDLETAGISMKEVTEKLVVDGVKLFADAFKQLIAAVEKHAGVRE